MDWKGRELAIIRDYMDALGGLENPEEAQEFMHLAREDSPYADENIGYLTGYFTPETTQRLQRWCGVTHPIFGRTALTPKEAFELGKRLAGEKAEESGAGKIFSQNEKEG